VRSNERLTRQALLHRSVAARQTRAGGGTAEGPLLDHVLVHGFDREAFLKYCTALTAALALPFGFVEGVARALAAVDRPRLIWLQFQDCTGDSESALRAHGPDIGELILNLVSWDYHELIMVAAGERAEAAMRAAIGDGGHLLVVEGSIPTLVGACTIAGKSARQQLEEVAEGAAAIINVGTCSSYGGLPRARPNPTGAIPVSDVVPASIPQINLPGCPVNAVNIVATLVHYLAFRELPATDDRKRPLFAYGKRIHDTCERRRFFDAGMFARAWGDEGHRNGYCLYELGCKGPFTWNNCATAGWNGGKSWPIRAGHTCFGCAEPGFWDTMEPSYERLPHLQGFGVDVDPTTFGVGLVAATAGLFAAHGAGKFAQHKMAERRHGATVAPAVDEPPASPCPSKEDD
jgi:hydrogenase small subunit